MTLPARISSSDAVCRLGAAEARRSTPERIALVRQLKPAARLPRNGPLGVMPEVQVHDVGHANRARCKPLSVAGRDFTVPEYGAGDFAALYSDLTERRPAFDVLGFGICAIHAIC